MKVRILTVCLLAACFVTESAFAEITATSDATKDSIIISGTVLHDETQVVLLKPGFDVSDAENAAAATDKSELGNVIEYFGQVTAKDKNIETLIPMRSDAVKGKYLLIVDNNVSSLYYAPFADRMGNMIPDAKSAVADKTAFAQFVASDGKYFCNSNLLDNLSSTENVAKYAAEILDDTTDLSDSEFMSELSSAMNMGIIMEALNENKVDDVEMIKSMTDDTDMVVPMEKIDLIKETETANIISGISGRNFLSTAEYKKNLSESIFINVIYNAANMSNADKKAFFEQYATNIGLDLTNYSKLNQNKRVEAIVNLLAEKNTSMTTLQSSFDSICKSLEVTYIENGNIAVGGGGVGGGGAGGTDIRAAQVISPAIGGSTSGGNGYGGIGGAGGLTDLAKCQWAKPAVEYLVSQNMISGYGDNTFKPDQNITRAEFITIIARKYLPQESYEQSFSDVASDSWYFNYIESAYNNGIISGIDDSAFAPNDNITRQDMAVILYRLAEFLGHEFSGAPTEFADDSDMAEYSKNAIYSLRGNGIVNGDETGNFHPNAAATRAEAAQMIYSLIKSFE